jgi:hypothetical protein
VANAPAEWLKQAGLPAVNPTRLPRAALPIITILFAAILVLRFWLR